MATRGAGAAVDLIARRSACLGAVANGQRTGPHRGDFRRGCSNWAGPRAATCASKSAGRGEAMPMTRKFAAELGALTPDVIVATGVSAWPVAADDTAVPIVFV